MGWTRQSRWRDKDLQLTSLIPWPGCPVGPQGMPPGVGTQLVEVVTKDEGGGLGSCKAGDETGELDLKQQREIKVFS